MNVNQLTLNDSHWAGELLGQAFLEDPMMKFVIGPKEKKKDLTKWLVSCGFRYGVLFGQCFSTKEKDGVLLLIPPNEVDVTARKIYKTGIFYAPFKLGFKSFMNFMEMSNFTENEHKKSVSENHYYLYCMGVAPERQGLGIGKKLVKRALELVDQQKMPCYLETQNEKNVAFYQNFGFEVVTSKPLPSGKISNWGMLRKAV